jgi:hypothetical protein
MNMHPAYNFTFSIFCILLYAKYAIYTVNLKYFFAIFFWHIQHIILHIICEICKIICKPEFQYAEYCTVYILHIRHIY